jgi:hypothetical protein
MNPIINPWWFYFISIVENVNAMVGILFVLLTLAGAGGLISFVVDLLGWSPSTQVEKLRAIRPIAKKFISIWLCLFLASTFIPGPKTIYRMLVTSYITPDNIDAVKGEVTDLIDYIIDKVDQLNDKDEK